LADKLDCPLQDKKKKKKKKKEQLEEIQKERSHRQVHRAVTGTSFEDIMTKRIQKPELREAQREQDNM
jgi:large subunit ribosomal protein L24e